MQLAVLTKTLLLLKVPILHMPFPLKEKQQTELMVGVIVPPSRSYESIDKLVFPSFFFLILGQIGIFPFICTNRYI